MEQKYVKKTMLYYPVLKKRGAFVCCKGVWDVGHQPAWTGGNATTQA
jgi:hypothetical protein